MQRKVEFEKWVDPFLAEDEQGHPFDDDAEWEFSRRVFAGRELKASNYSGRFLSSQQFGVFPLGEHNLPSKKHKLWYLHTNFVIDEADLAALEGVPGVAGLRVLDPYRAWVMVGWMFKDADVHEAVRRALCPPPPATRPRVRVDPLERAAAARFPAWAVVRSGTKSRDVVGGPSREAVEARTQGAEVLSASWEGAGGEAADGR
jgi:hypothetical protein